MNKIAPRSMLRAIEQNPNDAGARLKVLREMVAERLDATSSARETASLARVILDVEHAIRALEGKTGPVSAVDDLIARRAARGAS